MGVCQTKRASWYDNTNKLLYSLCLTTPSGFGGANTTGAFQILMRRLARPESARNATPLRDQLMPPSQVWTPSATRLDHKAIQVDAC